MNRNRLVWFSAWMALLVALIVACVPQARAADPASGGPSTPPMDLDGTSWVLVQIGGQAATGKATLVFADRAVRGNATCNTFFGPYERDGEALRFGLLASTMMACPAGMDQETAYLAALAATATYHATGEELVLADAAGDEVLRFVPRRNASLEGTTWQLTGLNTGAAFASVLADTAITATFAGGTLNGSAGCNSYFGSYTTDGSQIAIGPLASTEMFCAAPAGAMEQEQAFLAALASSHDAQIEGEVLTLSSPEGTRLLTFAAASD